MSGYAQLPMEWDLEAVREFYAERGLDYDKLSPRHYTRPTTFEQEALEKQQFDFDNEYAAFLARRKARTD